MKAFVTVWAIVHKLCTRLATPVICIAIFEEPSFKQTIRDMEVFVTHKHTPTHGHEPSGLLNITQCFRIGANKYKVRSVHSLGVVG